MRTLWRISAWFEWPGARIVLALVVAVAALPVLALETYLWTGASSMQPLDFQYFGASGAALLQGRWQAVFHDPATQAGPLELIPYGIAAVLHVTGRLASTVYYSAFGAVLTFAIALLSGPGRGHPARSALVGLGSAVLVTAGTLLAHAVMIGHPAEVLIPLLWLTAARLARRGSPLQASAVVALSAGFEVWGVLGAAVILLADRPRLLRSSAIGAAVIAALYGGFVLTGQFAMFSYHWAISPASILHSLWPAMPDFPWTLRLLQGAAVLAASTTVARVTRRSSWAPWLVVLTVIGVRLLLDPVLESYYWLAPSLAISTLIATAAVARRLPLLAFAAGGYVACTLPVAPPVRAAILLALMAVAVAAVRRPGAVIRLEHALHTSPPARRRAPTRFGTPTPAGPDGAARGVDHTAPTSASV